MLSQPQETLELQHKQGKPVAVTSLAFPYGDVNNFIVGSEEGHVYSACRHGSKVGITDVFEGHVVSCHSRFVKHQSEEKTCFFREPPLQVSAHTKDKGASTLVIYF